jgi:superfamily II DNA/RNA helicase
VPPTFADLGVPADLVAVLERRGITNPFPIQAATLPDTLAGHDISGRAPTGSGKTLAFGLPLVLNVGPSRPRRPSGLVLVPTRELAEQVRRELAPLCRPAGKRVMAVYGGVGYGPQRAELDRGVDLLVACPGRLEDLVAQRVVDLSAVHLVVLDEADRMADMGFLPAVKRLLDLTSSDRQTLLFSATLDGAVDGVVRRYQHEPRRHEVADDDGDPGDVRHLFWRTDSAKRVALAADVVSRHESAIVFCRTKHGADRVVRQLGAAGVSAVAIHGNKSQPQRERALQQFTSGRVRALVATDVAARGIHVDAVGCVIHFDAPADHKDYVHRSGRTGRAGEDGTVVTLVLPEQVRPIRLLQRALDLPEGVEAADVARLGEPVVREVAPVPAPPPSPAPADRSERNGSRRQHAAGHRSHRGQQGGVRGDHRSSRPARRARTRTR